MQSRKKINSIQHKHTQPIAFIGFALNAFPTVEVRSSKRVNAMETCENVILNWWSCGVAKSTQSSVHQGHTHMNRWNHVRHSLTSTEAESRPSSHSNTQGPSCIAGRLIWQKNNDMGTLFMHNLGWPSSFPAKVWMIRFLSFSLPSSSSSSLFSLVQSMRLCHDFIFLLLCVCVLQWCLRWRHALAAFSCG